VRNRPLAALASFVALLIPSIVLPSCSSDDTGTTTTTSTKRFKRDVVPIFQQSCALTACHSSSESNLGIYLTFDAAQIYAELQKTSPTAAGQKFVVAGDPDKSYVMVKMESKQSTGTQMPPDELLSEAKRDAIRAWIQAGAKND
jgi:hypothetical protein